MPQKTQKQINKENLLNQGVSLLMQQGYHGTGLKEILDSVKIPKGSFYNYFGNKENFGSEVIGHYIAPFICQLNQHLANPEHDAMQALDCYFNELINELEKNQFKGGCLLGNLMGEIGDTSEVCRVALQKATQDYRDTLQRGIEKAQHEGSFRTDKSAQELADIMVNMWQGALLRMKIEQSVVPLKQCCDAMLGDFFRTQC